LRSLTSAVLRYQPFAITSKCFGESAAGIVGVHVP
jgi:hypothetical protein